MSKSWRSAFALILLFALSLAPAHAQEEAPADTPPAAEASAEAPPSETPAAEAPPETPAEESGTPAAAAKPAERKPLTQDEAKKLFVEMGKRAASEGYSPDFGEDGCFWKAHQYESAALDFTRSDGNKLSDEEIKRVNFVPGSNTQQKWPWSYHTTVTVPVLDDDGKPQDMVFDPVQNPTGPMAIKPWVETMTGGGGTFTRDDAATDREGTRPDAYVSVVPNSHVKPGNTFPPMYGYADDAKTTETARALADNIFTNAFSGNPAGRRVWNQAPTPESVRLVFK